MNALFKKRKDIKMADIDNVKINDTNKLDETSYYVIKLFILLYSILFFLWDGWVQFLTINSRKSFFK